MGKGEFTATHNQKNISLMLIVLTVLSAYPAVIYAQATSIIINAPQNAGPQTSAFGRRVAPVAGASTMHRGVDYGSPRGTVVPTNAPVTRCVPNNGRAGNMADVERTCADGTAIRERYMHLQNCPAIGANSVTTGNTGIGTGPHLHYEIHVDGTHIDPNEAYGRDLCDPVVRQELLEDARNRGIVPGGAVGGGGGGIVGGGPPPVLPPTTDIIIHTAPGTGAPVTGCATDTWTAMVNQAVLQTRRETMTNQRFIAKADSIIVYSCFEDVFAITGDAAGVLSESQRWVNRSEDIRGRTVRLNVDMGQYSLDGALVNAVDSALIGYLDLTFNHDLLGGLASGPIRGSIPTGGPSQYGLPCGIMGNVWQMAKCQNASDEQLFFTFDQLVGNDPRIHPHNFACQDSGITQNMINIARHSNVAFDNETPRLDLLQPVEGACGAPIPTGVIVTRAFGTGRITENREYTDAVCLTAGCSYQNAALSGLGTCEMTPLAVTATTTPAE